MGTIQGSVPNVKGTQPLVVDIHTHMYPPEYIALLRSRNTVPYIRGSTSSPSTPRLVILPGEDDPSSPSTAQGRPLEPAFYDVSHKIAFMDAHNISISIISLANPWLDFMPAADAPAAARTTNDALNALCTTHPTRLYFFGALPLSAEAPSIVAEIHRLQTLPHMRGVIIGTSGLGHGLDDPAMDPIWAALAATRTIPFIHPHYGLPSSVWGPRAAAYGHVLPLALGFPLETTIAVARMFLGGVWERHPQLHVLLAHSGGALPFLAGRIESCVAHDAHYAAQARERKRDLWWVLKERVYLDAVVYGEVGLRAAVEVGGESAGRVMFGTDHPFFPPLEGGTDVEGGKGEQWLSVSLNQDAIDKVFPVDSEKRDQGLGILGKNAARVFELHG